MTFKSSIAVGLLGLFALLGTTDLVSGQEETISRNELRFVGEVLGKSEYGDKKNDVAKKWKVAPKLHVVTGTEPQIKLVKKTIRRINRVLPAANKIIPVETTKEATIRMYFVPSTKFVEVGKTYGITPKISDGYFQVWWDGNHHINRALIMLATDKLADRPISFKHCVLEEIVQTLGPIGDTKYFPHSVFFEDKNRGVYGTATQLSELDQKTLRFLYEHVPAGSEQTEIGYLMSKHWNK